MQRRFPVLLIAALAVLFSACASPDGSSADEDTAATLSSAKSITSFRFEGIDVDGTVDEAAYTITVRVAEEYGRSSLVPVIVHTGASILPASGVAQDFTRPVTYTVTAADSSSQAYTVTVTLPESSPSALSATALSSSSVSLSWTDNSSIETGFRIERKVNDVGGFVQVASVGAGVTSYTDTGLVADMTYQYRVRSYGDYGYSEYCAASSAVTPDASSGYSVSGVVYFSTAPLAGAIVTLQPDEATEPAVANAVTGSSGAYCFTGVQSGTYYVMATGPTSEYVLYVGFGPLSISSDTPISNIHCVKEMALTSPADGSTVSSAPTLTWEAFTGAEYYKIQVNVSSSWELVASSGKVYDTLYALTTLTNGTNYSWQVSAYDSFGNAIAECGSGFTFTYEAP